MTKPSYEEAELKKLAETVLDKYRLEEVYSRPDQIDAAETRFYAAATPRAILDLLAELARVRGLLQRSLNTIANAANDLTVLGKDCPEAMTIALDLMKALTTGAESADIGKLDTADRSRCKLLDGSTRVCELGTFACSVIHDMSLDDQFKGMATDERYQAVTKALLGSAETGGEKAAPHSPAVEKAMSRFTAALDARRKKEAMQIDELRQALTHIPEPYKGRLSYDYNEKTHMFDIATNGYGVAQSEDSEVAHAICTIFNGLLATFPRTSQSQTASSGVEGAHEGTTADKSELLPTQLPKEQSD